MALEKRCDRCGAHVPTGSRVTTIELMAGIVEADAGYIEPRWMTRWDLCDGCVETVPTETFGTPHKDWRRTDDLEVAR